MMTLEVVPLTIREANEFVANFHRHNDPTSGGKWAIGASTGDRLVGVAIVGRPIARLLDDGYTVEVLRNCVIDDAPKGTCSFLYNRCRRIWQAMGGKRIITYTLQAESGSSLRGAGWKISGDSRPQSWDREGRKRRWQSVYGQAKFRWEADCE